jgi:hypothetical protein
MITPIVPIEAPAAPSPVAPVAPLAGTGAQQTSILPPAGGGAPSLLPSRPGPVLIASLLLPLVPPRTVSVPVLVTPAAPGAPGPTSEMADLGGLVASLIKGDVIPATALPASGDGRVRLASGPLDLRLPVGAADVPEGTVVGVRLAPGRDGVPEGSTALARAMRNEPDQPLLQRLAPDVRLAGSLRAAAEGLTHAVSAPVPDQAGAQTVPNRPAPEFPPILLLGDPQHPVPIRLEQEQQGGRPLPEETDQPLTIDVTFGRLGRVRLELRAHGRGELALSLRSEMALPAEARDRLRDVVGAAFALGGRPAWFMVLTGPIPTGPRGAGFPA